MTNEKDNQLEVETVPGYFETLSNFKSEHVRLADSCSIGQLATGRNQIVCVCVYYPPIATHYFPSDQHVITSCSASTTILR